MCLCLCLGQKSEFIKGRRKITLRSVWDWGLARPGTGYAQYLHTYKLNDKRLAGQIEASPRILRGIDVRTLQSYVEGLQTLILILYLPPFSFSMYACCCFLDMLFLGITSMIHL